MSGSWTPAGGRSSRGPAARTTVSRPDRRPARDDPHRDTIDRWTAALSRGDDAEVDRLVRQSREQRIRAAASNPAGIVLGMVEQRRLDDAR